MIQISEILNMPEGKLVQGLKATVKSIGKIREFEGQYGKTSVLPLTLADSTGEINASWFDPTDAIGVGCVVVVETQEGSKANPKTKEYKNEITLSIPSKALEVLDGTKPKDFAHETATKAPAASTGQSKALHTDQDLTRAAIAIASQLSNDKDCLFLNGQSLDWPAISSVVCTILIACNRGEAKLTMFKRTEEDGEDAPF
jgi:hypothetical protein